MWDVHNAATLRVGASAARRPEQQFRLRKRVGATPVVYMALTEQEIQDALRDIYAAVRAEYEQIWTEEITKYMAANPGLTRAEMELMREGFWDEAERIIAGLVDEQERGFRRA